ncbi:MAG: RNA pseudouridine synthase [Bacteroidales bacterium]|nr:RNA pseudouridine synthase [Bacteroidales bacterium]MCF8454697.1 RNA pseudouridine synthase [Bacteroidales bacterium]
MSITQSDILYEDNHLIAINKKPGQIVQGDKTGDKPLVELVKDFIKIKYNKPGDVYLGIPHRLDRPVSGVVLFARTSKALTRLNKMFKEKTIHKSYWAVVKNVPPHESDTLIHYLKRNTEKNKSFAHDKEMPDSKQAELYYRIINTSQNYFLLEVVLKTGRHHQIRAQLSKIGCPIKGDLKYGFDRSNPDGSIHLHARNISFIHPVSSEEIEIIVEPPKDVLWDLFRKSL